METRRLLAADPAATENCECHCFTTMFSSKQSAALRIREPQFEASLSSLDCRRGCATVGLGRVRAGQNKIAQRLGRSVRAVRFRLGALGMSAKVSDGWSQRALRKLLRVSPARLKYFIGSGILRVRDPRVTTRSLLRLCSGNDLSFDPSAMDRITESMAKHDAYSWDRAADLLGIPVAQVQTFICKGKLKALDPFVTDRSFEEFCRKHGEQINMTLINPATAKWLINEYGVSESCAVRGLSRAQKHALVIRTCRCGRKVAGNILFKHLRHCRVLKQRTIAAAA